MLDAKTVGRAAQYVAENMTAVWVDDDIPSRKSWMLKGIAPQNQKTFSGGMFMTPPIKEFDAVGILLAELLKWISAVEVGVKINEYPDGDDEGEYGISVRLSDPKYDGMVSLFTSFGREQECYHNALSDYNAIINNVTALLEQWNQE